MAVESAADRLAFLNPDEFGVEASYTLDGGPAVTINAIFDAEHTLAGIGDIDAATVEPQAVVRTADLPEGHGDGDTFTLNGTAYTVRFPEPDGTGMTVLRLEKAP